MATESEHNSYTALKAKSPQACEFCDQVFINRFSSIVHNSSHIIIPLLKDQVHHCEICYIYFNSTDDFNTHINEKHPPVINNYNNNKFDNKVPEIKIVNLPHLNKDNLFEIKEETSKEDDYDLLSGDDCSCDIGKRETDRKYTIDEFENEEEFTDFINSKLKFEVDEEYGLLKNVTTDSETYYNKENIKNSIVYEEPVEDFNLDNVILPEVPLKSDADSKSMHYTDLMRFSILQCKYCSVWFSNRFSLIVHETSHLRINKSRNRDLLCPQCDKNIVGNYRTVQRHQVPVHGNIYPNKLELRACYTCGLHYTDPSRYISNFQPNENESLQGSKKTVKDPVQSVQKNDQIERTFFIQVCEFCYAFFRNSTKKIFILKETVSYTTRRPCHECKKLFFKLKTVKTITRIHRMSQIKRGSDRKRYTNENRLRNIQIRMKMSNKFS